VAETDVVEADDLGLDETVLLAVQRSISQATLVFVFPSRGCQRRRRGSLSTRRRPRRRGRCLAAPANLRPRRNAPSLLLSHGQPRVRLLETFFARSLRRRRRVRRRTSSWRSQTFRAASPALSFSVSRECGSRFFAPRLLSRPARNANCSAKKASTLISHLLRSLSLLLAVVVSIARETFSTLNLYSPASSSSGMSPGCGAVEKGEKEIET